jgi:hypothetical protein
VCVGGGARALTRERSYPLAAQRVREKRENKAGEAEEGGERKEGKEKEGFVCACVRVCVSMCVYALW